MLHEQPGASPQEQGKSAPKQVIDSLALLNGAQKNPSLEAIHIAHLAEQGKLEDEMRAERIRQLIANGDMEGAEALRETARLNAEFDKLVAGIDEDDVDSAFDKLISGEEKQPNSTLN